jgi:hypothetical protein
VDPLGEVRHGYDDRVGTGGLAQICHIDATILWRSLLT